MPEQGKIYKFVQAKVAFADGTSYRVVYDVDEAEFSRLALLWELTEPVEPTVDALLAFCRKVWPKNVFVTKAFFDETCCRYGSDSATAEEYHLQQVAQQASLSLN